MEPGNNEGNPNPPHEETEKVTPTRKFDRRSFLIGAAAAGLAVAGITERNNLPFVSSETKYSTDDVMKFLNEAVEGEVELVGSQENMPLKELLTVAQAKLSSDLARNVDYPGGELSRNGTVREIAFNSPDGNTRLVLSATIGEDPVKRGKKDRVNGVDIVMYDSTSGVGTIATFDDSFDDHLPSFNGDHKVSAQAWLYQFEGLSRFDIMSYDSGKAIDLFWHQANRGPFTNPTREDIDMMQDIMATGEVNKDLTEKTAKYIQNWSVTDVI